MDDYHNLSSFICPPSPQENSYLQQVAAKTPLQYLAANSNIFISTPGRPSTGHLITPMGYDYGCESSAESSDSDCVIISLQNVQSKLNATKRLPTKRRFT